MENAILKHKYLRTLTEKEYESVKRGDVKAIKRITGITGDVMVGDSMEEFMDKPIKFGLYMLTRKEGKKVYYIVQSVFTKNRAFCYSVY